MEAALTPDMLATDLAYYLVRKGVSSVGVVKSVMWKNTFSLKKVVFFFNPCFSVYHNQGRFF